MSPAATKCPTCAWIVSTVAQEPRKQLSRKLREVAVPEEIVEVDLEELVDDLPKAMNPKVCPACPQCRAPTNWMSEFSRFLCTRCNVYVG